MEPVNSNVGMDWIGLLATLVLGVVACFALYLNQATVAGTAVGAVAGYMLRIYGKQ